MSASEMLKLKEVILRSPRRRVLHLRFYRRATIYSDNSVLVCWTSFVNHSHPYRVDLLTDKANLNFLNLPFIPGDKLPPIQELQLWTQYNLNYQNCHMWRQCMDWDQLCRLDLRDGCPRYSFEQFRGRVRNLKSLRFGFI